MKKVMTLVLAIALVMSMAVPALAVDSPTAPAAAEDKTTALPEVVETSVDCGFISINEAATLSEEDQKVFTAAQESLKAAVPEGMTAKYFFYHVHVDDAAHDGLCVDTFDIGEFTEVVVKQFVDGAWVELAELGEQDGQPREVVTNSDGTITITGLVTGPVAFLIK